MILLFSCLICQAQDAMAFKEMVGSNLLSFDFTYEVTGNVPLKGSGTVVAQKDCFIVKSNGVDVYCDGKSKWTVDEKAKEVYIENAEDIFKSFPQLSDIKNDGGRISAVHKDPRTGAVTKLSVTNLKTAPLSGKDFSYNVPGGKDWVITDLRD